MMRKIEEYLALPYTLVVVHNVDEDGNAGWVAEVEELPGCMSQGASPEEAIERVREAMRDWIAVALEDGMEIPEPREEADFSGRFLVRIPASLHADLARSAGREGVSLNQFVISALAGAIGWRSDLTRSRGASRRGRSARRVRAPR